MITDLSTAIDAVGDFSGWTIPLIWTHKGTARVRGEISPNTDTAQTIMAAGGIPTELCPASTMSVVLGASVSDSFPYSSISPPIAPLSYATLDAVQPSTIHPDGSWTLDGPLTAQLRDVVILLTAEWDIDPVADTPTHWTSLAPLLTAEWANVDAEYTKHQDTVHLRGSISLVSDLASTFIDITHAGLPMRVPGDLSVEAETDGHDGPVDLFVGDWDHSTSFLALTTAAAVPTSGMSGTNRVAGGTFQRSYPDATVDHTTQAPPNLTGTDWAQDVSYPYYSLFGPGAAPTWRTPWWTWTVPDNPVWGGSTGFAPGPVVAIPALPDVDLSAIIAGLAWQPDWVTVRFHCSMRMNYMGWQTLADAKADAKKDASIFGVLDYQNPTPPYAHAYRSTAMVAVSPMLDGAANRKFASGDFDTSPGPYTGTGDGDAGWDPYNGGGGDMVLSTADCYLAPATPVYTPRGLIEPAGLEHAQLLWRPGDVGVASVGVVGEAQGGFLTCYWTITPLWELPADYLLAGDTITFTQRSWWPSAAAAPNFMAVL